jgi:Na+/proline symporter
MIKVLNAVAVTLLAAVVSVVPAALIGRHVPAIFEPGLKPIAVAAWISGMLSWYAAMAIAKRQRSDHSHEAAPASTSNGFAVGVTVGLLVLAVGIAVGLHFYGDKLLR